MYFLTTEIAEPFFKQYYLVANENGAPFPDQYIANAPVKQTCLRYFSVGIVQHDHSDLLIQCDSYLLVQLYEVVCNLLESYEIPKWAYENDDIEYHVNLILGYTHILQTIISIREKLIDRVNTLSLIK